MIPPCGQVDPTVWASGSHRVGKWIPPCGQVDPTVWASGYHRAGKWIPPCGQAHRDIRPTDHREVHVIPVQEADDDVTQGAPKQDCCQSGVHPKGLHPSAKALTSCRSGGHSCPQTADRIYVNLTRVRAQLAARARRFKREKKVQDTWVYDGDIYVKRGDVIIKIVSYRHLDSFV
ncbi:hypothetical protein ACOMHN_030455 [Nucella lapillus]